jgi:hypothetical protein
MFHKAATRLACATALLVSPWLTSVSYSQTITLQTALQRALAASPRLTAAERDVGIASGQRIQAGALINPEVSYEQDDSFGSGKYRGTRSPSPRCRSARSSNCSANATRASPTRRFSSDRSARMPVIARDFANLGELYVLDVVEILVLVADFVRVSVGVGLEDVRTELGQAPDKDVGGLQHLGGGCVADPFRMPGVAGPGEVAADDFGELSDVQHGQRVVRLPASANISTWPARMAEMIAAQGASPGPMDRAAVIRGAAPLGARLVKTCTERPRSPAASFSPIASRNCFRSGLTSATDILTGERFASSALMTVTRPLRASLRKMDGRTSNSAAKPSIDR